MADVQLVTSTRISKTSLTLGRGSPSNEPPAFTLPPRNARVSLGGTARLDGKVSHSHTRTLDSTVTLHWYFCTVAKKLTLTLHSCWHPTPYGLQQPSRPPPWLEYSSIVLWVKVLKRSLLLLGQSQMLSRYPLVSRGRLGQALSVWTSVTGLFR